MNSTSPGALNAIRSAERIATAAVDLLDAFPDASFLIDSEGQVLSANGQAESLTGYSRTELQGAAVENLVPHRLRRSHAARCAEFFKCPHHRPMGAGRRLSIVRKDGVEVPVDISLTPLATDGGALVICSVRAVAADSEQFPPMIEQLAVGVVRSTLEGRLLAVNHKFCEMAGYNRDEVLSLTVRDLSHPDEYGAGMVARKQMLREGTGFFERDARLMRKGGRPVWTRMTTSLLRESRAPGEFVSVLIDISHQRKVESDLRESELRFKQVTENIREVVWLTDADMTEAFYVNNAYEEIWGRQRDALAASPRDWMESVHPDDRPRLLRAVQARNTDEVEFRITRPEGTLRWIRNRAFPVLDSQGRMIRVAGIAEDITQRKATEDALRESERRFAALLQSIHLISLMLDRDARITYCNDYLLRLTAWEREEVLGKNWFDTFVPADKREEARTVFAHLLHESHSAMHQESEICTRFGERRRVRWDNTVLRSPTGEVIGTASIAEDVTERRRAEAQVEQHFAHIQQAMRSTVKVIATIAELRDPYTHGHEHRVGELAAAMGTELSLDSERIEGLRVAGYLHDVGKIGVPAEILAKPGRLDEAETMLVQQHAQRSYEILQCVSFPWPVAEIALQHHERMDGTGYPRGLAGDEILLEARILAIADTVDAMASHRPYRAGLGLDEALAEIERYRGVRYDSSAADACLRLFRQRGYSLAPADGLPAEARRPTPAE